MATTTRTTVHIDAGLKEIASEAGFLPELADLWPDESPVARDVWYVEWRELMARLEGLERAYRDGAMSAPQRKAYQALRRLLKRQTPLLSKLSLPLPSVPLED